MLTCQSVIHVATQLVSTLLGSVSHSVSYSVALSVRSVYSQSATYSVEHQDHY